LSEGDAGIRSINDLQNRVVGVISGSTGANFMQGRAILSYFSNTNQLTQSLLGDNVEAVVYDEAVLRYIAQNNPGIGNLVGGVFMQENYGIILQKGSPLTPSINNALQNIQQTGLYQFFYEKWFGSSSEESGSSNEQGYLGSTNEGVNVVAILYALIGFCILVVIISFVVLKLRRRYIAKRKPKEGDGGSDIENGIFLEPHSTSEASTLSKSDQLLSSQGSISRSQGMKPFESLVFEELRTMREIIGELKDKIENNHPQGNQQKRANTGPSVQHENNNNQTKTHHRDSLKTQRKTATLHVGQSEEIGRSIHENTHHIGNDIQHSEANHPSTVQLIEPKEDDVDD